MADRGSRQQISTPRNVYAFGLTSLLNDTASEMAYWVLPAFIASIGGGPAQLGIIEGVAESVASIAKLFSGYLADRVSRRKPLVVGGYIVANAVKPLLALVSSWWQILGIRFADRFAKGIRGTARDVMVAESVRDQLLKHHKHLMLAASGLTGVLTVWALASRPMPTRGRYIFLAGLLVVILLIGVGADLGGRMVYDYNAGGAACPQPIDFSK